MTPVPSKELLSVLVCPHDHGALTFHEHSNTFTCNTCARVFSIENGVPNMLK